MALSTILEFLSALFVCMNTSHNQIVTIG